VEEGGWIGKLVVFDGGVITDRVLRDTDAGLRDMNRSLLMGIYPFNTCYVQRQII
jgi:hypothetical protein